MINTVHEDDLAAWYRIQEPVLEISIRDFELEDDDPLLEGTHLLTKPDFTLEAQRRTVSLPKIRLTLRNWNPAPVCLPTHARPMGTVD